MDKEMKKEFLEMLEKERGTPIGWSIIMSMVGLLEEDDELERLVEIHKGVQDYGQYLTEDEAKKVVEGFRLRVWAVNAQKWGIITVGHCMLL